MKRYAPVYKSVLLILIAFTVTACSTYSELITTGKVLIPDEDYELKIYSSDKPVKSDLLPAGRRSLAVSISKYLVNGNGFNPESYIINKGVDEALKGNYTEAEILFMQVRDNFTDGSVDNNLAVIYELTKRKKEAHIMYMNALLKSPDNFKFRSNLLSFKNHNKFTNKKKSDLNTVK